MSHSSSTSIRVLVVDDHPVVRAGLTSMLETRPEIVVVGEAANGPAALNLLQNSAVDVMLLDLRMPVMNGIEVLKELKRFGLTVRTIMLSSFETDEDIYQAIQAGAWGYLSKEIDLQQMIDAISKVHSGRRHIRGEIAERLAARMSRCDLSSREVEILKMVAKGLTNKAIGQALNISDLTVKNHVNKILAKLDVSDRTEASTAAIQRGLIDVNF